MNPMYILLHPRDDRIKNDSEEQNNLTGSLRTLCVEISLVLRLRCVLRLPYTSPTRSRRVATFAACIKAHESAIVDLISI